jgi:hypothetical protein
MLKKEDVQILVVDDNEDKVEPLPFERFQRFVAVPDRLDREACLGQEASAKVRLDKVSNQALAASTSSSPASADMLKKEDVQIHLP